MPYVGRLARLPWDRRYFGPAIVEAGRRGCYPQRCGPQYRRKPRHASKSPSRRIFPTCGRSTELWTLPAHYMEGQPARPRADRPGCLPQQPKRADTTPSRQAGADHLNSIRHGTAETGMIRESSGRGVFLNCSPIECKQPPGRGGCSAGRALFLFFRGRSLESYRLAGLANVRQFDRQHPSISKITFCDLNLSFNALYVL